MKRMLDQKQIDQLSELLNGHVPNEKFKELIESLGGISLKMGYYIYNRETDKFEWLEEVPQDYSGFAYGFYDDGLYVSRFDEGDEKYSFISPAAFEVSDENGEGAGFDVNGINKLDFAQLTHSFNELDETLQQIIEDAITDAGTNGVACSEAQWDVIKALLDKALYINYDGVSLIKCATDGIANYVFGLSASVSVYGGITGIEFQYDSSQTLLFAGKNEI